MKCPGQDSRYWKEDPVFDVPCPRCGVAVELFKDEGSARCSRCGYRLVNPKVALGCAQWCASAGRCLGLVPQQRLAGKPKEAAMASRLIQAVTEELEADPARLNHALLVYQHAKELVAEEGGDPRVVLAAALLLRIDAQEPEATPPPGKPGAEQAGGPAKAPAILQRVGLDAEASRNVLQILDAYRRAEEPSTIEHKIVCDSDGLARLAMERLSGKGDAAQPPAAPDFRTESARARARSLFWESGDPSRDQAG